MTQLPVSRRFTDPDGDFINVESVNNIFAYARTGPAIYLRTNPNGVYVQLDQVDAFIAAIREAAAVVAHRNGRQCADRDCGPCSFDRAIPPTSPTV